MQQLPVTHPTLFTACSRAEAVHSCYYLWLEVLVPSELLFPMAMDDLVSPSSSALNPPATITLVTPPPASPGGRMTSPVICFLPHSTRYGTLGICGFTKQSQESPRVTANCDYIRGIAQGRCKERSGNHRSTWHSEGTRLISLTTASKFQTQGERH